MKWLIAILILSIVLVAGCTRTTVEVTSGTGIIPTEEVPTGAKVNSVYGKCNSATAKQTYEEQATSKQECIDICMKSYKADDVTHPLAPNQYFPLWTCWCLMCEGGSSTQKTTQTSTEPTASKQETIILENNGLTTVCSGINGCLDEYLIDGDKYHTAQKTAEDKGVKVTLKMNILENEILEYDIDYISGSGNQMTRIHINDIVRDYIGFWNGVHIAGNKFGTYHIKLSFSSSYVNLYIRKPDGSTYSDMITGITLPATFSFETRTGHNGITQIDYKNFVIGS